jgi:hypothetical protein
MVACHIAVEQCNNATSVHIRGIQHLQNVSLEISRQIGRKRTMWTLAPNACGGKLDLNFDLTTSLLPWGRVTRLRDQ